MKNKSYKPILIALGVFFTACNNFLDVEPKGYSIPTTVEDYDRMLNNPIFTSTAGLDEILYLTDETYNPSFNTTSISYMQNLYCWKEVVDMDINNDPVFWGPLYNRVYTANVVIDEVMDATGGTPLRKQQLKAEACFQRAYQYYQLMTLYAPVYDKATANTDLGVPLQTSTNITAPTQPRSTVQQCMDFIFNDLKEAYDFLPEANINKYRPCKNTVNALLARIYLFIADYANAEKYADHALQANHRIINYADYLSEDNYPALNENPQELWVIQAQSEFAGCFFDYFSSEALDKFDADAMLYDSRMLYFTFPGSDGLCRIPLLSTYRPNFGIGFPELYFIKAECLLRNKGDIDGALALVNKIREQRIAPEGNVFLSATTVEEALQIVLDERYRELLMLGQRWTDMRRLDKEGKMSTIERHDPEGNLLATLRPHDKAYVLQIPISVQNFNPGMPLNPR